MKYTLVILAVCIGGFVSFYHQQQSVILVIKSDSFENATPTFAVLTGSLELSVFQSLLGREEFNFDAVQSPSLQCGNSFIVTGDEFKSEPNLIEIGNVSIRGRRLKVGANLSVEVSPSVFIPHRVKKKMFVSQILMNADSRGICRNYLRA